MIHKKKSAFAGSLVTLKEDSFAIGGKKALIEDWFDRVTGYSWSSRGGFIAIAYSIRAGATGVPFDDEVLYCKIGDLGYIIHVS